MLELTYVGPHTSGVDLVLPDGRTIRVLHGGTARVTDAVAERLLEQGNDWKGGATETPTPPNDDETTKKTKREGGDK